MLGPEAELPYPDGVDELDYGLALAAMIGAGGEIAGLTLANDWSDRALARAERAAGFGPGKSRDFGLSLGPVLVTLDELPETRLVARVNGEERCGADTRELVHRWPELLAAAGEEHHPPPGRALACPPHRRRGPGAPPRRRRRARGRGDRRPSQPRDG